jgi:RHS repeat-associated protein
MKFPLLVRLRYGSDDEVGGAWSTVATTTKGYDALGRLTSQATTNSGGTTLSSYGFTYDAGDRLTSQTINGVARTFGYDALDQVTNDNGTAITYDANGNRTSGGSTVSAGNRLQSDGMWNYVYNAEGQVTSKSAGSTTWSYSYDVHGQMTSASDGTNSVSYEYDVFGNRVSRTANGVVERFAYDGWDTAKPGAVGSESFDVWGDLDASNQLTTRRLYGAGFDEPLVKQDATGTATWYDVDQLGSVTSLFDNSGQVLGSRTYDGFGAITTTSGTGLDRYAFTAREWDATLNLQYSRARMYNPTSGRWLSEDPMGLAAGDTNLHRYVGNNATGATDPSGYVEADGAKKSVTGEGTWDPHSTGSSGVWDGSTEISEGSVQGQNWGQETSRNIDPGFTQGTNLPGRQQRPRLGSRAEAPRRPTERAS